MIRGMATAVEGGQSDFGAALKAHLMERGKGARAKLALALGVSGEMVRKWETGENEPPRAQVWAIEEWLSLKAGTLSQLLGYLPLSAKSSRSVLSAIDADPRLRESDRAILRAAYHAAVER